ncbi:MAG TPA: hypothetical protein VGE52_16970, partial [Pirellulales bacterium]
PVAVDLEGVLTSSQGRMLFPVPRARDVIIRAQVKKPAGHSRVTLRLRQTQELDFRGTGFYGADSIFLGRPAPLWQDYLSAQLPDLPDRFFEIAFAAVGNRLMTFVEGRKVLVAEEDRAAEDVRAGLLGLDVMFEPGSFRQIEYQLLDDAFFQRRTPKPTTPAEIALVERRAAEHVIALGGNVQLRVGDRPEPLVGVDDVKSLPAEPFVVVKVFLGAKPFSHLDPLAPLKDCEHIEHLDLSNTPTWSPDLAWVAGFTKLRRINVMQSTVKGTAFKHLAPCRNLHHLDAWGVWTEPADLAPLKDHPIRHINLGGGRLANEIAGAMTSWNDVRYVNLAFAHLTDQGLAAARAWPELEALTIYSTQVTDAGLEILAECSKLKFVELQDTQVTLQGVEKLHAGLPQCKIIWSGGTLEPVAPAP